MTANFTVTAFKDNNIVSWNTFTAEKDLADLFSSAIHSSLNVSEAVVIQLPKDISIKLTAINDEVIGRVIDCTNGEPVITTISGKIGNPCSITKTPLAWTMDGEILIAKLVFDNI